LSGRQYDIFGHFDVNIFKLAPFSKLGIANPGLNYRLLPCYNVATTAGGLNKHKS